MKKIAIIGCGTTLAKNLLELLALRGSSKENIAVFENKVVGNTKVSFGEDELSVLPIENLNFSDFGAAIFTGHSQIASQYALKMAAAGIKVINATSAFEGDEKIPMIVGGINEDVIKNRSTLV